MFALYIKRLIHSVTVYSASSRSFMIIFFVYTQILTAYAEDILTDWLLTYADYLAVT